MANFPVLCTIKHAVLLLVLVYAGVSSGSAFTERIFPLGYNGSNTSANMTFAYDNDSNTYMVFNVSTSNMTFFNFNITSHTARQNVLSVHLQVELNSSLLVDDSWALAYSTDNGTLFSDLQPYSADNLIKQNLTYYNVSELNDGNWSWSDVQLNLKVALFGLNDSPLDDAVVRIYDVSANITYDAEPPTVTTLTPANNTPYEYADSVLFQYRATDLSPLQSCSLYINGSLNATTIAPEVDTSYSFNVTMENKQYSWFVNCTDLPGFIGGSGNSSFSVNANSAPQVEEIALTIPISVVVGGRAPASCNATITDLNGIGDIASITARLYDVLHTNSDADESSYHRTNSTCASLWSNATARNVSCGFDVWYYSHPGEWVCNITAIDDNNSFSFSSKNTTVSSLWGLNLTPLVIDFGELHAGENSTLDTAILVENAGNEVVDLSLFGYALAEGDNLSMLCTTGNISIDYERYSLIADLDYEDTTRLMASAVRLDNFDLSPKNDSFAGQKQVYFKMGVPKGRAGNCLGNVVFGMELD